MERNLRFKIDWASLMVGRKFTFFALFYFVFEGNCQVQAPPGGGGGVYLEGRFNGGFIALRVWRAYIWRGLYTEGLFFGILRYVSLNVFITWVKGMLADCRIKTNQPSCPSFLSFKHEDDLQSGCSRNNVGFRPRDVKSLVHLRSACNLF